MPSGAALEVESVGEREVNSVELSVPPLLKPGTATSGDPVAESQPSARPGDDLRPGSCCESITFADVVAVPVGDGDHVCPLGLLRVGRGRPLSNGSM